MVVRGVKKSKGYGEKQETNLTFDSPLTPLVLRSPLHTLYVRLNYPSTRNRPQLLAPLPIPPLFFHPPFHQLSQQRHND